MFGKKKPKVSKYVQQLIRQNSAKEELLNGEKAPEPPRKKVKRKDGKRNDRRNK